jgi:single-stranded-DNA-specific exonuclease
VIGIVASRLIETYHRPTLVFTKSKGYLVASARSVKGFDVYQALEQCSEYIAFFGGHKYAAGLSIEPENYQKFKAKFETVVSETLPLELKAPSIVIDAMINLDEITPKFIRVLKQFEPFGPENMNPVFCSTGLKDDGNSKTVGADRSHLKLRIAQQENHQKFNAIGFGMGNKETMLKDKQLFKSVYNIGENEWNGQVSIQLEVKDMKEEKSSDDL